MAERLMAYDVEGVVKAVLDAAKGGDMVACRIVLDRIAPPPRGRLIRFDVPPIATAADVAQATAIVLRAVADGVLTPDEAATITGVLETRRRAIETVELEQRVTALEKERGRRCQ